MLNQVSDLVEGVRRRAADAVQPWQQWYVCMLPRRVSHRQLRGMRRLLSSRPRVGAPCSQKSTRHHSLCQACIPAYLHTCIPERSGAAFLVLSKTSKVRWAGHMRSCRFATCIIHKGTGSLCRAGMFERGPLFLRICSQASEQRAHGTEKVVPEPLALPFILSALVAAFFSSERRVMDRSASL